MDILKVGAAALVLVNALVAMVIGLGDIVLTVAESGAIYLVASTSVGLVVAVVAHVRPETAKEPVALGAALLAELQAILGLLVVFTVFGLTKGDAALIDGVIITGAALVGGVFVRRKVTPVDGGS